EHAAMFIHWIREELGKRFKQSPLDSYFDVPYTSITSNKIAGGLALNIIPDYCEFLFEFRNLPQMNPADILAEIQHYINKVLLPRMQNEYEHASVKLEKLGAVPAFEASEAAPFTQLMR